MITIDPPGPFSRLARLLRVLLPALLFTTCSFAQTSPAAPATPPWRLVWADEFNGASGSSPDPTKWTFDIGGSGFDNRELESYTSRPLNAQQKDGNLVITALREDHTGPDMIRQHYTSARIRTQGLFTQRYGRFEARIQLPLGKGIWPAFWMLGDDIGPTGWPGCGEIDIFENIGDSSTIFSTIHGPGYNGPKGISARYVLPAGQAVNTAFHLYAVEWAPNDIKFFLDEHLIAERTPADLPAGAHWAFDHPFFLLLNVAVGGNWPGSPDATTVFPQRMLVDYVRVYTKDPEGTPASAPAKPQT